MVSNLISVWQGGLGWGGRALGPWSYGRWIYICSKCLLSLTLLVYFFYIQHYVIV